jgi:hypothetical protein
MKSQPSSAGFAFDARASYRIHLTTPPNGPAVTTLEGELLDQAALAGVLNTLYELHMPVLEVKCLSVTSGAGVLPEDDTA